MMEAQSDGQAPLPFRRGPRRNARLSIFKSTTNVMYPRIPFFSTQGGARSAMIIDTGVLVPSYRLL